MLANTEVHDMYSLFYLAEVCFLREAEVEALAMCHLRILKQSTSRILRLQTIATTLKDSTLSMALVCLKYFEVLEYEINLNWVVEYSKPSMHFDAITVVANEQRKKGRKEKKNTHRQALECYQSAWACSTICVEY